MAMHILATLALILLAAASCGGGATYVQFSPAEETPTRVQSDNGMISALFPPESLADEVEITLRDRSLQDSDAPGVEGRSLAVALELSGSMPAPAAEPEAQAQDEAAQAASVSAADGRFIPAELSGSVEISISLARSWPLATPLDVQSWNAASQRYEESGISASLSEDGNSLEFSVTRFGRYALYGPLPAEYPLAAPAAPRLSAASSRVRLLEWDMPASAAGMNLYRRAAGEEGFSKLNDQALATALYTDLLDQPGSYEYALSSLRDNGIESELSAALPSPTVDFDLIGEITHKQLRRPDRLYFDNTGQRLLVCDSSPSPALLSFGNDRQFRQRLDMLGSVEMREPAGVSIDPDNGNIYLVDSGYRQVFILDSQLGYRSRFGAGGNGPGEFMQPTGIASDGNTVAVLDAGRGLLQLFTPLGVYLDAPLDPLDQQLELSAAQGLSLLADGSLAIADSAAARVVLLDNEFGLQAELLRPDSAGELAGPYSVAADAFGRIFVSEPGMRRVSVFDESGEYSFQFGSEGLLHVEFGEGGPLGLALDPATGYLYVSDPAAGRIAIFSS